MQLYLKACYYHMILASHEFSIQNTHRQVCGICYNQTLLYWEAILIEYFHPFAMAAFDSIHIFHTCDTNAHTVHLCQETFSSNVGYEAWFGHFKQITHCFLRMNGIL